MAAKLNMMMFLILATVALFQSSSLAATYEVGDSLGWTIPPGGSVAYSTWAANKTFKVGDILGKSITSQYNLTSIFQTFSIIFTISFFFSFFGGSLQFFKWTA